MSAATYTGLDGRKFTVEYDPKAPCVACGLPVVEASMGGTALCPWCDCGFKRERGPNGEAIPQDYRMRVSTDAERAAGKAPAVMDVAHKATSEEYAASVALYWPPR